MNFSDNTQGAQDTTSDIDFGRDESLDAVSAVDVVAANAVAAKKSSKPKDFVSRDSLTQEILKENLRLDADGYFYWVKDTVRSIIGDFAGSVRVHDGKYTVVLKGTAYSGDALKAFYETGVFPPVTRGRTAGENAKPAKSSEPRVARVAPSYTPEQMAEAKALLETKRASTALAAAAKKLQSANVVSEASIVAEAQAEDAMY